MSDEKMCPMKLSEYKVADGVRGEFGQTAACVKEKCAWWVVDRCAVADLAVTLDMIWSKRV